MHKKPSALSVVFDAIPSELKAIDRWVLWSFVRVDEKWKKLPRQVNGKPASSTDPSTWSTYDEVVDAFMLGEFDGIGLTFDGSDDVHGIDIDDCLIDGELNETAKELLENVDGYAEVSPSGTGIKLFTRSNLTTSAAKKSVEVYREGRYFTVTGHRINGHDSLPDQVQDVSWFVEKHIGKKASAEKADALALYKPPLADWDIDRVRAELVPYISDLESYEGWLKVGMVLHHQGQGGHEWMELWDELSRNTGSYDRKEIEAKWDSFSQQRDRGQGALTLASLIKQVSEHRKEQDREQLEALRQRIETCDNVADLKDKICIEIQCDAELDLFSRELLVDVLKKRFGELGAKVSAPTIKKLIKPRVYSGFVHFRDDGSPKQTLENFKHILEEHNIVIRYDEIKKETVISIDGLTTSLDNNLNVCYAHIVSICESYGMGTAHVGDFIMAVADENLHNPVISMIEAKEWDGVPRVQQLIDSIESEMDPAFKAKIITKWMVSAVAVAYKPSEVTARGVLVFQGKQNIGKTRWLQSLAPKDLVLSGHILDPENKDSVTVAISHWLVELGEIDSTFKKSEISALKAFLSKNVDKIRRPYAKAESRYMRRTVFYGSVNEEKFLFDSTGNTRFWSLPVTRLDADHGIDIQQLWAEVKHLWLSGKVTPWLDAAETEELGRHNAEFEAPASEIEEILATRLDWSSDPETWSWMNNNAVLDMLNVRDRSRPVLLKSASMLKKLNGDLKERRAHNVMYFKVPRPVGFDMLD